MTDYIARRTSRLPPVRFLSFREPAKPETGKHLLDRLYAKGLIFYFNSSI